MSGLRQRILVVTCPQLVHLNLCIASSCLVGCGSTAASFSGLRHFGHVSFIKRSRNIAHPFRTPPVLKFAQSETSSLYKSAHFASGPGGVVRTQIPFGLRHCANL